MTLKEHKKELDYLADCLDEISMDSRYITNIIDDLLDTTDPTDSKFLASYYEDAKKYIKGLVKEIENLERISKCLNIDVEEVYTFREG